MKLNYGVLVLKQGNMKSIVFFLAFLSIPFLANGQLRLITGKVVDEFQFEPIPAVEIQTLDTVRLGNTDIKGNFKIGLPVGTDQLLLSFIGMEWTSIRIPANCNNLEIIMLFDGTYCFMTPRRVIRKRYRIFKNLSKKHYQAHSQGIFTSIVPCVTYIFRKY